MVNKNGVSVVLCCYNSEERLPETLKHLAAQKLTTDFNWEIIVVDNNSQDNTATMARTTWNMLASNVPFHVINQPTPGLSFAREKGIEYSSFNYILFCDDDNWLDSNYIDLGLSILTHLNDVGVLGGKGDVISDVEIPEWYNKYSGYYATFPQAAKSGYIDSSNAAIYGAGMFLKKEVFLKLKSKNFKSILTDRKGSSLSSGGDFELSYAARLMGYKLYYDERLTFKHYMPKQRLTFDYLVKLTSAIGYSNTQLIAYNYVLKGVKINWINWVKDLLYKIKYTIQAYVNYYFKLSNDQIDLEVSLKSSVKQLQAIWGVRSVYMKNYNKILALTK